MSNKYFPINVSNWIAKWWKNLTWNFFILFYHSTFIQHNFTLISEDPHVGPFRFSNNILHIVHNVSSTKQYLCEASLFIFISELNSIPYSGAQPNLCR